jgi:hypothetical protein
VCEQLKNIGYEENVFRNYSYGYDVCRWCSAGIC